MNVQKAALLIVFGVISVIAFIYLSFDRKEKVFTKEILDNLEIVEKWNLPEILDEVSGIAMIDKNRIAAVQDEDGIIFIYNLKESRIEKQIEFSGGGDYEGIALVGSTAYVLRSDGNIFEVQNFLEKDLKTVEIESELKGKYNFEGLCYDSKNNRLLIAAKEKARDDHKPVFAYDLQERKLNTEPALRLSFNDPIFEGVKEKKKQKVISPSEINIHPSTGNIYILEGVEPKIVILDSKGNSKNLLQLSRKQFNQAEGLTFGPKGEVYISNEGKGGKANILQVKL